MSENNLECRLAVGAVLLFWSEDGPHFIVQKRDKGIAESGKIALAGGFVDTHKGETLFDGLVRELGSESDGILTKEIIMGGVDCEPVYTDTVVGWAFNDKRTQGIAEMNKSHYFHIVEVSAAIAKQLIAAGNQNAEVRNWLSVKADKDAIMALDWAEWRNIKTPDVAGDFHQRTATLNALVHHLIFTY